ncbi:MAG: GDSL-type esterase/lipase family protein [Patescibacteria group bacterium]|nr:GDSL-type esterase/lipase family protein [Patescibacteria group bacterium]
MNINICIFGDSITWGASDFEKGGWVERLKTYCTEKYDVNIYNLGIPGDITDNLLKRLKSEAIIRSANIIIFAIGINDSSYVENKDNINKYLQKFDKNILRLIKISKKITDKIIFIGLTKVDEKKTVLIDFSKKKVYDNEVIEQFDNAIKNICEKNSLQYIEIKKLLNNEDLDDGLHPNSIGHEKMFDAILESVNKFLK